jgi:hypothetical protein
MHPEPRNLLLQSKNTFFLNEFQHKISFFIASEHLKGGENCQIIRLSCFVAKQERGSKAPQLFIKKSFHVQSEVSTTKGPIWGPL